MGIPFVPVRGLASSDTIQRRPNDFTSLANPFNPDEQYVVARAINPDVAIFHGLKGDRAGNVVVANRDAALLGQASRKVIVTVEEIVDKLMPEDPMLTFIPALHVTAVVHAPFGAYPTACPPYYSGSEAELVAYVEAAKSDETFRAWLAREVLAFGSHDEYVAAKGLARELAGAAR